MTTKKKKIVFVTGTRADFGKLKSLMHRLQDDELFEVHVFVTGMHMLSKYGYTCEEVEKNKFQNIFKFINQNSSDRMDHVLAKTITGLSDYVQETRPDLLVIHGDRVEALAGAAVGALNNFLVAHVEGGEVSGTVDELIRHSVSKLSHTHFVANESARVRLNQLGETGSSIYVIGSPDIDVMNSDSLPSFEDVQKRYSFDFRDYGILMFHPVTSDLQNLRADTKILIADLIASGLNYIVIYPNNDHGTDIILEEYEALRHLPRFRVYPSVRFEHFLTLMKEARFIIGNSSAGVREAPHFGIPSINLGTRQMNRVSNSAIMNINIQPGAVMSAVEKASRLPHAPISLFGEGQSAKMFHEILSSPVFWKRSTQKYFVDRTLE